MIEFKLIKLEIKAGVTMYKIVSTVLFKFLVKMRKNLVVFGNLNIPKHNRYVVTCTHESYNEIIMLAMALHPNQIHFMAKKELFENKWVDKFFRNLNAFPVNRENPGPSTLKIPVKHLNQDRTVGMFPSGHRTKEEVPLKRGAATIAMLGKAQILPAAYVGPNTIKGLITDKSYISFGEPIDTTNLPKDLKRAEKIDYIMKQVESETRRLQRELNERLA